MKDFLLFSGSSNLPLAERVAKILGTTLGKVELTRFADGEIRPWIAEDVRGKTVIALQSFSYPMDEHIMELALMGDAIRRSAPKTMVAVVPYFGYARQDKQHRVGEPVSARVIAKFLEVSKFKEVITVDLHNDAIVGFFQIPVTHVSAMSVLVNTVQKMNLNDAVVVSPDVGGVKRARNLAFALDIPLVVMEKKRFLDRNDQSESYQIIGDVAGKTAIVIDDVVSSGGTLVNGAATLKAASAKSVIVLVTHAVLADQATNILAKSSIDQMITTDTIVVPPAKQFSRLQVVTVAQTIADAIGSIVR